MIRVHGSIAGLQRGYLVDLAYNNPRRPPSSRHHSIAPHLDTMNSNPNATVLRDRRASRQQQSSRYGEITNTNENACLPKASGPPGSPDADGKEPMMPLPLRRMIPLKSIPVPVTLTGHRRYRGSRSGTSLSQGHRERHQDEAARYANDMFAADDY
jgi:hypothetical protein